MAQFLGKTLVSESLSRKAERSRAVLLQRLENHIGVNSSTLEGDYEEPTIVAVSRTSSFSSFRQSEDGVKVTIPFSELQKTTVKCGPLSHREKGIFLHQWRRYWTGLYEHFLLMYASQRDVKPCTSVNIQGFVARPAPSFNKDQKKKDAVFEIVCPGKRDYQFIARTVKDMDQWVTAICQASVQHIQSSVPLLPRCTPDRSAVRGVMNVPATAENDSEIYDDAGSGTQFNGETEDIYQQSEEEEFYQDIPDFYQKNLVLESKPGFEVKPAEERPPLPPRRYLPSAFEDNLSDQESVYDDIFVSNRHTEYLDVEGVSVEGSLTLIEPSRDVDVEEKHSWVQQNTLKGHKKAQSQLFMKCEVQNYDNGEEEIYDDVGVTEELPKAVKLPILQQQLYVGNGGGVQNCIRERETYHSNGGIPWVQQNTPKGHKKAQPRLFMKCEVQNYDNGEEEIYDDVGVTEELPKAVKLPILQQQLYVGNGGDVQNCIREHETCHSIGGIPTCGHDPNPKTSNQFQYNISTTYKSMNNCEEDTATSLPRTPTAYHNSKYNISNQTETNKRTVFKHMKTTQEKTKIFSPRTSIATQRPEIPPRPYLKQ